MSLRKIATELAAVGHFNERGQPFNLKSVRSIVRPQRCLHVSAQGWTDRFADVALITAFDPQKTFNCNATEPDATIGERLEALQNRKTHQARRRGVSVGLLVAGGAWRRRKGSKMFSRPLTRSISAGAAIGVFLLSFPASACTRFVYQGGAGQVVTGRTMDWKEDIGTNLWVFPKGMARTGETGANSITWTSKYGSVIASGYDIATTDGLNEVGLVANVLWLVESEYPEYDGKSPGLAISAWAQFVLDNYGTVAEAVEGLRAEPFTIVAAKVPGSEMLATVHLSLSDKSGDSAIVEYIGGKQVIHHSRDYQVMTNSPVFEQQLALNAYWKEIGGTVMLPGTNRAADRFARASFYVNAIPKTDDPVETIASAFSVIRNVSVPFGISTPDQPNISSTRWRTVIDHKRGLYFFESVLAPNVFWVDLAKFDLAAQTGKVMKLDLGPGQTMIYSGMANGQFKEAKPFKFLGLAK